MPRVRVMDKRMELLAPAGDEAALRAAVCAGADAVYLGLQRFGARASAANFDAEALEYRYPTVIAAKLDIADELAVPLSKLSPEDRVFIDQVLTETLVRKVVLARIREHFRSSHPGVGEGYAG